MANGHTLESFEFQWNHLPSGAFLLSDTNWRDHVAEYIVDELGIPAHDLRGKQVLDAGMGQGRWAYGFQQLGCEVFGFDTSPSAIAYANTHARGQFDIANILDTARINALYRRESMDIIFSWGVLHHTGNPELALKNLVPLLKPNGLIHLYLYTRKSFTTHVLRSFFNHFTLPQRKYFAELMSWLLCLRLFGECIIAQSLDSGDLHWKLARTAKPQLPWHLRFAHNMFDAFSPSIADEYTEEDVTAWFQHLSLTYERVHPKWVGHSRDLFINGRKTV